MASIIRRAKKGESFRITVPGVDAKYAFPQGTLLVVQRHYGQHSFETVCDVEVVKVPETEHPLLIKVPKGAEVLLQEED